jgi:hypothetical protein
MNIKSFYLLALDAVAVLRQAWSFTDTFRLVYSFTEGLFAFVVSLGFDGRDYFSCLGIWTKATWCISVYAC